jgi:hypothetical protein
VRRKPADKTCACTGRNLQKIEGLYINIAMAVGQTSIFSTLLQLTSADCRNQTRVGDAPASQMAVDPA